MGKSHPTRIIEGEMRDRTTGHVWDYRYQETSGVVTPVMPPVDYASMYDRFLKKIIAGMVIAYVTSEVKRWARS